jgi:hypothetical protein
MSRKLPPSYLRRIAGALAVAAVLLLSPLPASGGIAWDMAAAVGYAALVFTVILYLYPLRGDGMAHRRLFTLSQHRRIGWIALILALSHAALLLGEQPLTARYLLPSAPLYMGCGLAAVIALALLVWSGLRARSALRRAASPRDRPLSIATHATLAALLLGFLGAHIIGSGQMVDRPAKIITTCVLLAVGALGSALRPRPAPMRSRLLTTAVPSAIAVLALFLMPTPTGTAHLLLPMMTPSLIHVNFPHEHHRTVNCVVCHHNFVDKTGLGSCIDCHRSSRPDLPHPAEVTFHVFCRDCHRELALQEQPKHGPVRECSGCHVG